MFSDWQHIIFFYIFFIIWWQYVYTWYWGLSFKWELEFVGKCLKNAVNMKDISRRSEACEIVTAVRRMILFLSVSAPCRLVSRTTDEYRRRDTQKNNIINLKLNAWYLTEPVYGCWGVGQLVFELPGSHWPVANAVKIIKGILNYMYIRSYVNIVCISYWAVVV